METLPTRSRPPAAIGGWLEPLELRIAPANFVLPVGAGPYILEVDPLDSHLHITDALGNEVFDQGVGPYDDLFVTGGGGADGFTIAASAAGPVSLTGTLSVIIPGQINVAAPAATGVDFVLTSTGGGINYGTTISLGASDGHFTAARNLFLGNNSMLTTDSGDIVLMGNPGAGQNGTFIGIQLDHATISTTGTGTIRLTGTGGNVSGNNVGIALVNDSVISSTSTLATSGAITLQGNAGPGNLNNNHGVFMAGAGTLITSVRGAISVTGFGNGAGTDNNVGVLLGNGAQIATTSASPSGGSITVLGQGGGGGASNHGVVLDGSGLDPKITTATGSIVVTGTGDPGAAGANSHGISIAQGGQVLATGTGGTINLGGSGGGGTSGRHGIFVGDVGSLVRAQDGMANLTGTGGGGGGAGGNNGVLVANGGKVSVGGGGAGTLSITGTGGSGGGSDGIAIVGINSIVESTGGSGLSLISNNLNIDPAGTVNATIGVAKLLPQTGGSAIDLGGPDVPNTVLGITDAELDRVFGTAVEIGNVSSGAINLSSPLTSDRGLILNTGATVFGVAALTLGPGASLTVNSASGADLSGVLTVPGTATFTSGAGAAITAANAGNSFSTVSVIAGGSASFRDDGGFDLGFISLATLLTVESAGTITQSGTFAGSAGLTKLGNGTLILTAANGYGGTTTVSAGTLQVGAGGTVGTLGGGSVTNNALLDFNRGDALAVANPIGGTGAVTKSGTGALTLGGNSTYSGATTVAGGTLLVDGSLANTASVGVATGATLGGSGTIAPAAPVTVNGFLAPGGSPGVLNTGNIVLNAAGSFNVEVNGTFPNHDQLSVTGSVTLGGTGFMATGAIPSVPGQQIVLIANDGNDPIGDTFAGLAEGAPVTLNGVTFNLTYAGGTNNNDVVLIQPPVETEVTISAGDLVITDIAAGGHDDTLTIQDQSGNGFFVISDPNHLLAVTGIPGATLSADLHTVSVPSTAITGTRILVNSLAGNDALTVDLSLGPLTKALTFDGGTHGAEGDALVLTGKPVTAATFNFTNAQDGSVTLAGSAVIAYLGAEAVNTTIPTANLTLNYSANVANTISTPAGAPPGGTLVTATAGAALTFTEPSATLSLNGGPNDDTINLIALRGPFPAVLRIDGQGGDDSVNLAAGLPALGGLTVVTETVGTLPLLQLGVAGLEVTATSNIAVNGDISSGGPVKLRSGGAITVSNVAIVAADVTLTAVDSVAMRLDGARVVATTTGPGGVTLIAVNNPVTILALAPGTGSATLAGGDFLLGKTDAISGAPNLTVDGTLDLNGSLQTIGGLAGSGTITNSSPVLSTFTVGANDGGGTFSGNLQGHLALGKIGAGTLILSGPGNSYDAGTRIGAGTLQFDAGGSAVNGGFELAGGKLFYNFSSPLSPSLTLAENSTIGVAAGKTVTLTAPIVGPDGLTKTDPGTLVLESAGNSFGGQTTRIQQAKVRILGGTLQVPNDGALGDVANDVEIDHATFAASGSFGSARNFTKTGGVATIDAQVPTLTLINKAIVPGALTPTNPGNLSTQFTYADGAGTPVIGTSAPFADGTTITFGGKGTARVHSDGMGGIDTIELSGTDRTSKLIIKGPATGFTTIKRIVIDDPAVGTIASIGSIVLGENVRLGDKVRDSVPELFIEGTARTIRLYDLNPYALVHLGDGLPHGVTTDQKTPSTKTNRPDLTIHEVLGPGVLVDLTPSDLPPDLGGDPVGGGGLGKVIVDRWSFPGFMRTTQSVKSFKLLHGDARIVFEIDKLQVGSDTTAGVGSMTIQNGSWGSSGSELEGACGSFNADAFLAGATLTAASMGKFTLDAGAFAGLLTLTDPDAAGIPTFVVVGDFSGSVDSAAPLRKIRVKGDFTGELEAPFIGSITAYAFLGTNTPGDFNTIEATDGALGTLTATAGVVRNFSIVTSQTFKGFNVKLGKLTDDTIGIDHVHIQALSIGNISVNLAAAATGATGIALVGIRNSEFITTGTGTTKADLGNIGNITVTLTGATGGNSAMGMVNSTFDVLVATDEFGTNPPSSLNALGKIAVKITGQDGPSLGLDHVEFLGNSIGATMVVVSRGKSPGATASGIAVAGFTATGGIGALTIDGDATSTQVTGLNVSAGTTVGAITVKAKTLAHGTLADSAILAGQSLVLTASTAPELTAALAQAGLGAVKVTGSITHAMLVAGASIGAVTAGGSVTDSLILAGAKLGGDFTLDGDETYQRAAGIAAITVKGAFARTSIVAGIDPTDLIFGNVGDTLAAAAGVLPDTSSIGPISLASGDLTSASTTHQYAIQAARIGGLKLGAAPALSITAPQLLDLGTPGEDGSDVLVRVLG